MRVAVFSLQMAAIALCLLSWTSLMWHTEGAMAKVPNAEAVAGTADAKTPANRTTPVGGAHDAGSSKDIHHDVLFLAGGIDRVILTKRDEARNLCIQVTLDSPPLNEQQPTATALKLPPNWAFERAIAVRDAKACRGPLQRWPAAAVDATEVAGSVRWGKSPTEGTTVDLRLSFPARGAEPAFTETMAFKR